MNRGLYLRIAALIATSATAWLVLWPSLSSSLPTSMHAPAWVTSRFTHRISPGLDIRGGMRLMYQVGVDDYVRDLRNRKADELVRRLGVRLRVLTESESTAPSAEKLAQLRARVRVDRVVGLRADAE